MINLFVLLSFTITAANTYRQGPQPTSRFSSHQNFNLLSIRGICGIQSLQEKVWGGNSTGLEEYPWMALLEYKKNGKSTGFQCGGVLISDKYVVTAAHCLEGEIPSKYGDLFNVRFGEHDLKETHDCYCLEENGEKICSDAPVNIEAEEAIPHLLYDNFSQNRFNDIGLVRLKTPVKFTSFIKPICLPLNNEKATKGTNLTVAGWGLTEKGVRSNVKLQAILPVVSNEDCTRAYIKESEISDKQVCAGGKKGIDTCNGDSGGPLMANFPKQWEFYLEGIVSYGIKCGVENIPSVYTRVDKYIDWILDNMEP